MLQPDNQAIGNQILQDMFTVFNHLVQKIDQFQGFLFLGRDRDTEGNGYIRSIQNGHFFNGDKDNNYFFVKFSNEGTRPTFFTISIRFWYVEDHSPIRTDLFIVNNMDSPNLEILRALRVHVNDNLNAYGLNFLNRDRNDSWECETYIFRNIQNGDTIKQRLAALDHFILNIYPGLRAYLIRRFPNKYPMRNRNQLIIRRVKACQYFRSVLRRYNNPNLPLPQNTIRILRGLCP